MQATSRREFLRVTSGATAGMASWLALGRAPAFAKKGSQTASGWKAVPWFWISFPATYNMTHFKQAGLETPKTWAELLHHGKIVKKQGNPVGIAISHCADANSTFWSVLWSYGGK